jgi:hypothetical protein
MELERSELVSSDDESTYADPEQIDHSDLTGVDMDGQQFCNACSSWHSQDEFFEEDEEAMCMECLDDQQQMMEDEMGRLADGMDDR